MRPVTLLLLIVMAGNSALAQEWIYINPVEPRHRIVIARNPDAFGIDDVRAKAEFCESKDNDWCIKARGFQIHIPKKISRGSSWKRDGLVYKVVDSRPLSLLGVVVEDLYTIDRKEPDKKTTYRFLYSSERGLLGIGAFTKNSSGMHLLQSRCGYGASSGCATK